MKKNILKVNPGVTSNHGFPQIISANLVQQLGQLLLKNIFSPQIFKKKKKDSSKYIPPHLTPGDEYDERPVCVGRTLSLADKETKKENGTNHIQIVKYAIT